MKKALLTSLLTISFSITFATGIIRGVVIDESNGEPIMNVNIMIEGTSIGTVTDFDGNYSLKVKEGKYNIIVSSIGYTKTRIENVMVVRDKIKPLDITLDVTNEELTEIIITATKRKNSASALLLT